MRLSKVNILGIFTALLIGSFLLGLYIGDVHFSEYEKMCSSFNSGDILTASADKSLEKFDFTPYWRVWNILDRKFIPYGTSTKKLSDVDRMYNSIDGLVSGYNDPYTVFMRPKVSKNFKIKTKGSLEGIGAIIGEKNGDILVVAPLPGSPAESAGLVAGDRILSVDDVETKNRNVDDVVSLIRGEKGTKVKLTVKTEGGKAVDVFIVRGTIEIPSTSHVVIERDVPVHHEKTQKKENDSDLNENIDIQKKDFYILRLFSFSQTSIASFKRELESFLKSGSDSLIIDLRGNPGGYIESAVQIASWFLPEGSVVVREYNGPEKKEHLYRSYKTDLFKDKKPKMVILVDKGTASAAEILAGALQEYDVATLVGTNTFGKGCVQELVDITDKLSLKVTVARWYTPNGVSISEGGLTPDVKINPKESTSTDPWLDAAIDILSE
jgi:carboxyl-terminal processing protease